MEPFLIVEGLKTESDGEASQNFLDNALVVPSARPNWSENACNDNDAPQFGRLPPL